MSDENNNSNKAPRRKGLTSLTLQWLADKLRRTDKIKEEIAKGAYKVDSSKVAQAIVSPNSSGRQDSH